MELQQDISLNNNKKKEGKSLLVIVDRFEGDYAVGRTEYDSPEVDQEVLISIRSKSKVKVGDFIKVKITQSDNYDLIGEMI